MLNWTEKDIEFIADAILEPLNNMIEKKDKTTASLMDTYEKAFDKIVNSLRQLDYEILADRSFMLSYLSLLAGIRIEDIKSYYKKYCEEFDKLNKDIFDKTEIPSHEN